MLTILEYQFPLRYQLPLPISEKNQIITVHLDLINFQDPTHKSNFNTYYPRTAFDLLEKLVETKMWMFLEYQFPLRYQLQLPFLKNLRGTVYAQLINIQDTIHKRTFDTDQMILNFHKSQLRTNICVKNVRISVPSDILGPYLHF